MPYEACIHRQYFSLKIDTKECIELRTLLKEAKNLSMKCLTSRSGKWMAIPVVPLPSVTEFAKVVESVLVDTFSVGQRPDATVDTFVAYLGAPSF
jgi:hypothetical protein